MAKDPYKILGIDKRASDEEIKRAYRTLARRYHPDMTGDDVESTERFKNINDAYAVLSDAKRRRQFDLFGDKDDFGFENPFASMTDAVSAFFRREGERPRPGCDVEAPLDLSFKDAWLGLENAEVEIKLLRPCEVCEGEGHPQDAAFKACPKCAGTGKIQHLLGLTRICGRCTGKGEIPTRVCEICKGKKTRKIKEALKVRVPAGVSSGTRLRLKGRGPVGTLGAQSGDLYLKVYVGDDARFVREGTQLRTTLAIPLKMALTGGELEVPLPDGDLVLKIPPRTQGGQIFRIRGRGFPNLGEKERGDFLVQVKVQMPRTLDEEGERLLAELADHL